MEPAAYTVGKSARSIGDPQVYVDLVDAAGDRRLVLLGEARAPSSRWSRFRRGLE